MLQGLPVIIMNWAEGKTLREYIDDWSVAKNGHAAAAVRAIQAIQLIEAVCCAVFEICEHLRRNGWPGAVHGDLKPENIKVRIQATSIGARSKPHVWILDFGEAQITQRGTARGITWAYASPEFLAARSGGKEGLKSSDQYQVGVCLEELLRQADGQCPPAGLEKLHRKTPQVRGGAAIEHIVNSLRQRWQPILRVLGLIWWRISNPWTALKILNAGKVCRQMTAHDSRHRFNDLRYATLSLSRPLRATLRREWKVVVALVIATFAAGGALSLSGRLRELTAEVDRLSSTGSLKSAKVGTLSDENDRLKSDKAALESKNVDLQKKIAVLEGRIPHVTELTPDQQGVVAKEWGSYLGDATLANYQAAKDRIYTSTLPEWKERFGDAAHLMIDDLRKRLDLVNGRPILLKSLHGNVSPDYLGRKATLQIIVGGTAIAESTAFVSDKGLDFNDVPVTWALGQGPVEFQCLVDGKLFGSTRVSPAESVSGAFALFKLFGCTSQGADGTYRGVLPGNDKWDWTATIAVSK